MAGALLAGLFRQLFRKLTQNVRKYLQLCLDKGTQFVVGTAIKSQVGGTYSSCGFAVFAPPVGRSGEWVDGPGICLKGQEGEGGLGLLRYRGRVGVLEACVGGKVYTQARTGSSDWYFGVSGWPLSVTSPLPR